MPEPVPGVATPAQPVVSIGALTNSRLDSAATEHLTQRTTQQTTPLRPAPTQDPRERTFQTDDAPQPTTVHVTIGRIEIRAAARPTREPRRPAANPAILPLNEYLRRHKGGA